MEGVRVTTMLSHDMHSRLEEIAKKEFSNKNVLLRQAVALFLKNKVSNGKFHKNKALKEETGK
jgi:predicted transcriptional regulator